jgi:hypothetical protein
MERAQNLRPNRVSYPWSHARLLLFGEEQDDDNKITVLVYGADD